VVATMDELETAEAPWKCDNELGPRRWTPDLSQDHGEYRARRLWNQSTSKPYMNPCVVYEAFSKFLVGTSLGAF